MAHPSYSYANRIGTTRKSPYTGDQLPGERNQFGEPMGSRDPMFPGGSGSGHGSNLDSGVFAPREFPGAPIARSPLAPAMRSTGVGPSGGLRTGALRTGTLAPPMLRPRAQFPALQGAVATGATGHEAMLTASSPASTGFPGGDTQRTATGLQSFQPDSHGGRMVGTTSPTLVPRGGGEGVVTNPGQTAFDEKGMQSADTTTGPARIYDPSKDMSKTFLDAGGNATVPGAGTFPGGPALPAGANGTPSARGVMIDPKYQTPGASPIGVISGGTVSDVSGAKYDPASGRTFPGAQPAASVAAASAGKPWPGALTPSATVPTYNGAAPRPGFGDLHVAESFPQSQSASVEAGYKPPPLQTEQPGIVQRTVNASLDAFKPQGKLMSEPPATISAPPKPDVSGTAGAQVNGEMLQERKRRDGRMSFPS